MTEPSVCAVMLTADRPEYARRAVEAFRAQTYANKKIFILDTGLGVGEEPHCDFGEVALGRESMRGRTIGELRNAAAVWAGAVGAWEGGGFDILIHFDDDDWSHPNRIAEQVALLQSSGADVVGYREMLFWREPQKPFSTGDEIKDRIRNHTLNPGEAWLYSCPNPNYALGSSFCMWRSAWERKPFEATSQGEDERFLRGLKVAAHSSLPENETFHGMYKYGPCPSDGKPRMIARIHAGNTSTAYDPRKMEAEARKSDGHWKRFPWWDAYCAETMK